LPPGGIVGVSGPNGAGKTTLFRLITGQEKPDAGSIRLGDTLKLAYVDQSRDLLDPEKTAWQEISDGFDTVKLGSREVNSRAYVARFNFSGSDQQKKVGNLSGGERNRVHLAKTLKQGANVLLLDEVNPLPLGEGSATASGLTRRVRVSSLISNLQKERVFSCPQEISTRYTALPSKECVDSSALRQAEAELLTNRNLKEGSSRAKE